MQRIFRPICQRVSYQACRNYTATGGGGGKGGRTFVSEQEVQEAIQQLDWETMAREAEWDWSRNWYEDEGFGEGWLPNEWDDDWMQELQEMGKVPGGPQGAAMKQQLKEVETQAMIQDAATIARKVIKETMDDSKPTSGPEAVILEVMAKLEAGRTDFTDEEQTVVAKLLALTDSADAAIKRD
jgi:hypothetical protein